MRAEDIQRTDLRRYAPHMVATTMVLVVLPLIAAYRLSRPPYEAALLTTTVICTLVSVGLGRIGARLWQRHPGSHDVVFDDLLAWGFVRRLRNERRVIENAERLAGALTREDQLKSLMKLATALEVGDPYTHGHSDRVARHAYMIARTMKLPRSEREKIRLAGALHDVGKLRISREILTKPDRLTDEEFEIIKRHPGDGAEMVATLQDEELTAIVRHHHERLDGTGYPHRLSKDKIPLGSRIISVADTFDAITSKRSYRASRKHKDAIDILVRESGTQLDPEVVKAFITYYTGRRGIRLWLSISSSAPRLLEASVGAARRAITNAAVVGGTATVIVGGAAVVEGIGVGKSPTRVVADSATEARSGESSGEEGLTPSSASEPETDSDATERTPGHDGSGDRDRPSAPGDGSTGAVSEDSAESGQGDVAGEDTDNSGSGSDSSGSGSSGSDSDGSGSDSNSGSGSDNSGSDSDSGSGSDTDNSGSGSDSSGSGSSGSDSDGSGSGSNSGSGSDNSGSGSDSGSGSSGSGSSDSSGSGSGGDSDEGLLDIIDDLLPL